jgi:hypothetical protein
MSTLADLIRKLNANWEKHIAADREWDQVYECAEAQKRDAFRKRCHIHRSLSIEAQHCSPRGSTCAPTFLKSGAQ